MKTCSQCQATYPEDVADCPTDGLPLLEVDAWPDGTMVKGGYRIVCRLSQDLVCVLYKAVHLKSNRICTLKVMSQDMSGYPGFVRLFRENARQQKKLHHPNVARVEKFDHTEYGIPFMVMEYVEGLSLRAVIDEHAPLPPLRVCAIARQVAAGLAASHARGIVQRDLTPESIFLIPDAGDERIKIVNLGIPTLQQALLGDRFGTSPETVIGTLQYLSPEQALGQFGDQLDGRSDLYALGVIMYQMLTRELPFQATCAADWIMSHISENPIPIRVVYADLAVPDLLTNLVLRCLEKNREARPASARDLVRELACVENEIQRAQQARLDSRRGRAYHKPPGWYFWKR